MLTERQQAQGLILIREKKFVAQDIYLWVMATVDKGHDPSVLILR